MNLNDMSWALSGLSEADRPIRLRLSHSSACWMTSCRTLQGDVVQAHFKQVACVALGLFKCPQP
jgi:hypothetical protein